MISHWFASPPDPIGSVVTPHRVHNQPMDILMLVTAIDPPAYRPVSHYLSSGQLTYPGAVSSKRERLSPLLTRACSALALLVLNTLPTYAYSVEPRTDPSAQILKAQGESIYEQRCAACHDNPVNRIPPKIVIGMLPPDTVVTALTQGKMQSMAAGLTADQIKSVATYLTGAIPGLSPKPVSNVCASPGEPVRIGAHDWPSVDRDPGGSRFQPRPGLRPEDIPRLRLKWAFAFGHASPGPPVIAGNRLFLSMENGVIQSLDRETGCSIWTYEAGRQVRMVTVAELPGKSPAAAVFFGDDRGFVTALQADTGQLIWKTQVDDHPLVRLTSPPMASGNRVFVPVSSMEDPMTHDPNYACCTFRGSVVALNAATGEVEWKSHTIERENRPLPARPGDAPPRFSPAGGAVFTPLTVDAGRQQVYAGTAESYDRENPAGSYSVIAFDMVSGRHNWERQFLPPPDSREQVCEEVGNTDCRNVFSMSTQVMLHTLPDGDDILIAGQKWGYAYGLDPDNGELLWQNKIAHGGDLGGLEYGFSVDESRVYISISDIVFGDYALSRGGNPGGLVALDAATGKTIWRVAPIQPVCSWGEDACSSGQVSATTAIPGAVFSGAWDGHMRAYSTHDGAVIWDVDTARPVQAVNGVEASGGHIAGWPVQVVDGAVYVTSGASAYVRPGNALLVYTVDGK